MTAGAPDLPLRQRKTNIAMIVITVLPFIGLLLAVTMSWNEAVGPTDLLLFFGLYVVCGFGITIGFHRMLTHRAFEAIAPLKAALLVAGSLAIQGPAIDWAVDHRTHHAFSDKEGDPHSPHHGFSSSIWGRLRGLGHAHVGWMFDHSRTDVERYAKDLRQDRLVVAIGAVCSGSGAVLPADRVPRPLRGSSHHSHLRRSRLDDHVDHRRQEEHDQHGHRLPHDGAGRDHRSQR